MAVGVLWSHLKDLGEGHMVLEIHFRSSHIKSMYISLELYLHPCILWKVRLSKHLVVILDKNMNPLFEFETEIIVPHSASTVRIIKRAKEFIFNSISFPVNALHFLFSSPCFLTKILQKNLSLSEAKLHLQKMICQGLCYLGGRDFQK